MFENQIVQLGAGAVTNGQTTASVELAAAAAGKKNRVWLDYLSLGAAGYVTVKRGNTAVSHKIYFGAAGTQYVGLLFESAANEAITLAAVLSAASVGSTPVESTYRSEQIDA